MISVKDAADALGVDPRTIREKLATGQLKGEKRLQGLKEKWFVYRGEIESLLEQQRLRGFSMQDRVSTQGMPEFFTEDTAESIDIDEVDPDSEETGVVPNSSQLEVVIRAITKQFSEELQKTQEVLLSVKKELDEKDRQLKLLPDLEKKWEEERIARNMATRQLERLQSEVVSLQEETANKAELEQKLQESEGALEKLSLDLQDLQVSKEKLQAESERMVTELQRELKKLKKPLWKKWFLPREIDE